MVWFQFLHKWRPLLVLVLDGYNLHARLWRINSARPTKNTASLVQYFLAEYHSPACTEQKHVFCVHRKREHPNLCGVWFNDETRDSAVKKVRRAIVVRRNTSNQDIISGPRGTTTFAHWREATTHVPLSPSTATVVVGAGPWLLLARGAELRASFTLAGRRLQSTTGGSEACTVTQTEELMTNSWVLERRLSWA